MPYIILTANGEELQRTELTSPVIIGRSAECQVAVRDVLLSRKHCRLEPGMGKEKGHWKLIDLNSRNGSHMNWKKISRHTLVDGDAIRVGRTWVTFKSGPYEPAAADVKLKKSKLVRPADPHEALSGTIADFIYAEPQEGGGQEFDTTPSPLTATMPKGKTIYSPLNDLSSSWDSIVATTSRPKRMARPIPRAMGDGRLKGQKDADLSLQALPMQVPFLEVVPPMTRRRANLLPAVILTVGIGLATLLVLVSGWVMTKG